MKRPDRIAFVKSGPFSHTNQSVLEILQSEFPKCAVDVIDVRRLPLFGWRNLPRLGRAALRRYGVASLRSKRQLLRCMVSTPEFCSDAREQLTDQLRKSRYLFTFQTQALFDASMPGTPHFVYTDHTHLANLDYPSFRREDLRCPEWIQRERSVYLNATLNFTMSTNITSSLIGHYGCEPERVECVYAGTNVAAPDPRIRATRRANKTVLFVGVVWERKGGPALVDAFEQVRRVHSTAELVIVGCSPEIRAPGCKVIGRIPLTEVSAHYERASVFCVPTRIEPFGIVFIEALAHAVPVVATRLGALPDFVIENETGYLVEPDDSAALAARLITLLDDPARRERLGEAGRRLVASRYNWRSVGVAMRTAIERRLA